MANLNVGLLFLWGLHGNTVICLMSPHKIDYRNYRVDARGQTEEPSNTLDCAQYAASFGPVLSKLSDDSAFSVHLFAPVFADLLKPGEFNINTLSTAPVRHLLSLGPLLRLDGNHTKVVAQNCSQINKIESERFCATKVGDGDTKLIETPSPTLS
jgi:hypothetical protein